MFYVASLIVRACVSSCLSHSVVFKQSVTTIPLQYFSQNQHKLQQSNGSKNMGGDSGHPCGVPVPRQRGSDISPDAFSVKLCDPRHEYWTRIEMA
jgi:hypothetical protein